MNSSNLYKNLPDESRAILLDLAEEIKSNNPEGRVILFLGAGANYNAPKGYEDIYRKCDRPPVGRELNESFIDKIWPPEDFHTQNLEMKREQWPLSYTCQIFEEKTERRKLILNLHQFIGDKEPSPVLNALAEMPFKYIVTTNYDQLFEKALKKPENLNSSKEYTMQTDMVNIDRPMYQMVMQQFKDHFYISYTEI